jgi:predicted dehydrogenase
MNNLTPQQKAIGKENFQAVIGSEETRRDFLKKTIMAGAVSGAGLGSFYYGYSKSLGKPVRVAVLGTGDEGNVLIGGCNPDFIEVRAIADIRPYSVYRAFNGDNFGSEAAVKARPGLVKRCGYKDEAEARRHVKVYADYHELLREEKDIEAVIIALPLHLHAPAAIAALKAGKHVITEKLMAHTVHECKEMARFAKQRDLLLAVGHQRHYNILYDNAVDTIRRGILGEIHYIRAQWHRDNLPGKDSWSQPLPPGVKEEKGDANRLTKELAAWNELLEKIHRGKERATAQEIAQLQKRIAQKEFQIKDADIKDTVKDYGYQEHAMKDGAGNLVYHCPPLEELIRWRLWDRTSAGLMAELGSHQLDAASIFIAAALSAEHDGAHHEHPHPLNVAASATRPLFPPDRDVEDHVCCLIEFPGLGYKANNPVDSRKKIAVNYASINGNGFGGYGEIVFGSKGTLILEKELEALLFKDSDVESKVGVSKGKEGPTLDTQASGAAQSAAVGAMATQNVSRGYTEELEHFAWCLRNRSPENLPKCRAEVAMGDAVIALTTNKAAREGVRIEFKEEWFQVDSDETPEGVKPDLTRYV